MMFTKYKKRGLILLSVIIAALLCLAVAFMLTHKPQVAAEDDTADYAATVTFDDNTTEYATVEAAWTYANGLAITADKPAEIKMFADAVTTSTLTVTTGKYVTLDLNGCMLRYNNSSETNPVITVVGTFTLKDSNNLTTHNYDIDGDGLWIFGDGGAHTLSGGVITGGTGYHNGLNYLGGGVFVRGMFTMEGGTIAGNTASAGGGGVYVNNTFTMTGGTISGNTAIDGSGGVEVNINSTFSVAGAPRLIENKSTSNEFGDDFAGNSMFVIGALENDGKKARIGVYYAEPNTTGYGKNNKDANGNIISPSTYFVSTLEGFVPTLDEEGEVFLSEGVATVTFSSACEAFAYFDEAWAVANDKDTTDTASAVVTIFTDMEIGATLAVAEGKNITLDLNGNMLKYTDIRGSVITVNAGARFTLTDTSTDTSKIHTITPNSGEPIEVIGGVITGGKGRNDGGAINQGGGVYVTSGGTFVMENGSICGNMATNDGGGVYVASGGAFIMKNGSICGNFSYWSGGVYVDGSFEISGAPIIADNKVNVNDSNVKLANGKKITVTGALAEGAKIGVSDTGDVAVGFTQADDPSEYFISDIAANNCVYVSDKMTGTVTIGAHELSGEWIADENSHWRVCVHCGAEYEKVDHSAGDAATCTAAQTCTECEYQIAAALGHTVVTDNAVPPTCTKSGKTEGSHCSVCSEILVEQITVDALGHTLNYNPAAPPTYAQNGNIEFWDCEDCDKFFADEDGKDEITDKSSVIVPKLTNPITGGGISGMDILWITLIVVLVTAVLIVAGVIIYRAKRKAKAKKNKKEN